MQHYVTDKSRSTYGALCIILGWSGAHHFYLRRHLFGLVYLLTFGLFGIGWLYDLFRMDSIFLDYTNSRGEEHDVLRHDDMKLLTMLLGFTGIQHFILKRYTCGLYFLLTFGGLGIGWVIDIFRIHLLTENHNLQKYQPTPQPKYLLSDAYIYCLPLGFLGLHHFYLSRPKWGIFYLLTLGNFGLGWITDIVRLKSLVLRHHDRAKWLMSDAFILWFPLGLFGAHWLYLNQKPRAAAYALTLGYLGVGWLIDIRRIPVHIRSLNRKCMLAGIIHAEDADSLQWDDSDFSSALLPDHRTARKGILKVQAPKKTKVHLSRMTSRAVCLECGAVGVCIMPCTHFSLCIDCVQSSENCPRCYSIINGWATVDI